MAGMLDQRVLFLLSLLSVRCLSVHALNELAREALTGTFAAEVWVVGEIHGLKLHAKSGHLYFDLVDKASSTVDQYHAKVSCAFFKGSFLSWRRSLAAQGFAGFELASGIEVKVNARVDLFVKEGRYQLIVSQIDPTYTFGAIAKRRAQTIEYLKAHGLMDRNKGIPLPLLPLNIGLITSDGSAAYKDFTSILLSSAYAFRITLNDTHMQGDNAIPEVVKGIRRLQDNPDVDTIVIIRGGGAKTDLFVFDDVSICRAIAECTKPVITGIGHEIDLTIADLTAHSHFVTPTDAARFLVGEADTLWGFLEEASLKLTHGAGRLLERSSQYLGTLAARLAFLTQRHTMQAHSDLRAVQSSLLHESSALLTGLRHELERRHALMLRDISARIGSDLLTLERFERELILMRPEETLRRGYSITLNEQGKALRDSGQVKAEDHITSVLLHGSVQSVVYGKEP